MNNTTLSNERDGSRTNTLSNKGTLSDNKESIIAYYEKLSQVIEEQDRLLEMNKKLKAEMKNDEAFQLIINEKRSEVIKSYQKEYKKKKCETESYHCPLCNTTLNYYSKSQHLKSKKHKSQLSNERDKNELSKVQDKSQLSNERDKVQ